MRKKLIKTNIADAILPPVKRGDRIRAIVKQRDILLEGMEEINKYILRIESDTATIKLIITKLKRKK